ncbi:PAS domain S-box protein [Christiangramia aquimixticola]|uniref:PAS domain S-box protein n=1 Tax=Christiangramia aquimixticola TaxID=1697558 RepID=UPI003AA83F2B
MDYKLRIQQLENELAEAKNRIKELESSTSRESSNTNYKALIEFNQMEKSVLDFIHCPLLILDQDLKVVFANNKYQQAFGKENEDPKGKNLFEIDNNQWEVLQSQKVLEPLISSATDSIHQEIKFEKTGTTNFLSLNAHLISLDDADKGYILLSIEDNTEKRKAELKLEDSEQKYKELVHSSNSLMAILSGPDMIIETANKSIKKVWGKGNNVEGRSLFEVLPEIKKQGMPELFRNVYKTGEPYIAKERPIKHEKNGKLILRYFDFIYQPQRNSRGEIEGVSVIANDVTQQALLNKKIRKSEREFRHLVNFMPHKIGATDPKGFATFYNKSWLDYTGKTLEEMLSEHWDMLIHPSEREEVVSQVQEMLKTGNPLELELRIKDKNGDYKWHLARTTPIIDEDGEITSWLTSSTEIQKLKEEEERKEGFLKLVSHELKTPVTSIKGYVQLLLSIMAKEKTDIENMPVKPYLNRIESQVDRLIRLISEMLDLSRIEQNEMELQLTTFDLNKQVEDIVEDLTYTNTDIQIEIEHECECKVMADRDRIGQVIINFVNNALKYSPDSNRVEIKVFREDENNVAVSVRDFGIGIDEKEQQQIFKRFYRISGNNDETYAGFGIGLYLSNEIIERHNGRIFVNSTLGEGSEFTFTLPLNQN